MDYSNIMPARKQASTSSSTQKKPEALGLDFLDSLKEAERVEVTIPFPVTLTWDPVTSKDDKRKVVGVKNIRFYTSNLANASFEVKPYFEHGYCVDAVKGEPGTLVVSCAKQDSMFEARKDENGYTRVSFKAHPRFVSFNGRKAVKYADRKAVETNLHDLMSALNPANGETVEEQED